MSDDGEREFSELLEYLLEARGFDFRAYKPKSFERRIIRRLETLGLASYCEYRDFLEAEVIPRLLEAKGDGGADKGLVGGLLQSAMSMPRAGVSDRYLHEDIFEMAVGEDDLEAIVRSVAEGNTGKADIAVFFREATGP